MTTVAIGGKLDDMSPVSDMLVYTRLYEIALASCMWQSVFVPLPMKQPLSSVGQPSFQTCITRKHVLWAAPVNNLPVRHHLKPTRTYRIDDFCSFFVIGDLEFLLQEN